MGDRVWMGFGPMVAPPVVAVGATLPFQVDAVAMYQALAWSARACC
jgi:hypothetical protein